MIAFDALTLDQKLRSIHDELVTLRSAMQSLAATKAARDDTAEHMNAASRALMERNARRNNGTACPECQDVHLVYDALGTIPCPACSPCIRAVDAVQSHGSERDRP